MNHRIYLFAGAAALSLAGAGFAQQNFDAVQVRAETIRPGVAVLFGSGGNIGVSHGPDGTLIVDDQFAPLAGKIRTAIAGLGATPVKYLVNTHWHFDHSGGNQPFGADGAIIVAQTRVRDRLIAGGTVAGNASPPAPPEALPDITYDHAVSFHLNGDVIDLVHGGGGHTDGDTAVYWRRANVLHTGDMMMKNSGYPFIDTSSGGNVLHLLTSLDQLIAMTDADTVIIPGHGPLARRGDLIAWRTMIATAVDRIRTLKDAGRTLDQAKAAKPLDGLNNDQGTFFPPENFVEGVWRSLEAH